MNRPVKWVAKLAHVREVSLLGTADLAFWKDWLRKRELLPTEKDGRAQVLIVATDARFWGVQFQELILSVLCRHKEGTPQDASYLIGAFNSRRLFAFSERLFFSTPYEHADVRLSVSVPAFIQLVRTGEVVFEAKMWAGEAEMPREPSRRGEDGWEGPVFLPSNRSGQGNVFFARIRGHTETYPFLPNVDSMTIKPSPEVGPLQTLVDSQFVAQEWAIREDARHAKSKTYKQAMPFLTPVIIAALKSQSFPLTWTVPDLPGCFSVPQWR